MSIERKNRDLQVFLNNSKHPRNALTFLIRKRSLVRVQAGPLKSAFDQSPIAFLISSIREPLVYVLRPKGAIEPPIVVPRMISFLGRSRSSSNVSGVSGISSPLSFTRCPIYPRLQPSAAEHPPPPQLPGRPRDPVVVTRLLQGWKPTHP